VVLFLTVTSGIVADLEMRGEGTLGGIWVWIDTIRPAGQAFSHNPFLRPRFLRRRRRPVVLGVL
jgi:hypothetical protein